MNTKCLRHRCCLGCNPLEKVLACMACAADHEGVLAVGLEDILQTRLDLILHMACSI